MTKSFLFFKKFFSIRLKKNVDGDDYERERARGIEVFFVVAVKNHHHDCYYPLLHCMWMTELQCHVHIVKAIRESLQILLFIPRVIKSSSMLNNTTENVYFLHRLLNGLVITLAKLYHKRSEFPSEWKNCKMLSQ